MRPYIIEITESSVSVVAQRIKDAQDFARNYCGDYRIDYRNHNRVELRDSEPFGDETIYHFSITRGN